MDLEGGDDDVAPELVEVVEAQRHLGVGPGVAGGLHLVAHEVVDGRAGERGLDPAQVGGGPGEGLALPAEDVLPPVPPVGQHPFGGERPAGQVRRLGVAQLEQVGTTIVAAVEDRPLEVAVVPGPGDAQADVAGPHPFPEERDEEPVALLPPPVEGADVVAGLGPQPVDRDASGGHTVILRRRTGAAPRPGGARSPRRVCSHRPSTRQARVAAWRLKRASTSARSRPLTSRMRWRR